MDPSGPCAKPQGLALALRVLVIFAPSIVPANPLAETTLVLVTEPEPGPVNAIEMDPAPGVIVTPDPAVKDALVKVLPLTVAKKDAQMVSVYRVRLGQRLGQDFGKVLAVQSDQLVVQELALSPTGEWQTREVRLPLQEAAP